MTTYTDEDNEYRYRFCRRDEVVEGEMFQARDDGGWYGLIASNMYSDHTWVRARRARQWSVQANRDGVALISPTGEAMAYAAAGLGELAGNRLLGTIAELLNKEDAKQ